MVEVAVADEDDLDGEQVGESAGAGAEARRGEERVDRLESGIITEFSLSFCVLCMNGADEKTGSVRIPTPSSWTNEVDCPSQVTDRFLPQRIAR